MTAVANVEIVKQDIIALYTKFFGSVTAKSYAEFYTGKDLNTVLVSANELFEEYAGEAKGKEILNGIYTKYNIKPN